MNKSKQQTFDDRISALGIKYLAVDFALPQE